MSFNVVKVLLAPNVLQAQEYYSGSQFRWKNFVFRPAEYHVESLLLLAVAVYLALSFIGKAVNKSKANAWLDAHREILAEQFARPTNVSGSVIVDGGCDFYNFSTGRRGVQSLHTVFSFLPRHDIFNHIFLILWQLGDLQYRPYDKIELDFTLSPDANVPNFVFAVVNKDDLKPFSQGRWDLTFGKTSDNPALSSQYTVITEASDVTDQLLKSTSINLAAVLRDSIKSRYFRSLAVTDLPSETPDTADIRLTEQPKHVVLTLEAPSGSHAGATADLVRTAFAVVDYIESKQFNLRPETKTKLRKARTDVEAFLAKQVKQEDQAAADKKRAEKRKAEEERVAKLSAAEQKKHDDKERKRAMRKAQTKGAVRARMA